MTKKKVSTAIQKGDIVVRKDAYPHIKGEVRSIDGDTAYVKWFNQTGTRKGKTITLPKKLKMLVKSKL